MQTPHGSAGFRPDEAFTAAAERFFELLKSFGMPGAGKAPDWSAMAAPLAGQFEQWLRLSQSAVPWFGGAAAAPGAGVFGMPPFGSFGPLPLGPAAAGGEGPQRTLELLGRLAQLQGEIARHWSEIAATAAQRFVARLGTRAAPPTTPDQALKLYEQWVSCAEEAYGATVHKEDFARLQAEIANTSAALLGEQRRHVDSMARAFGLPTRGEVDELYAQLKELRRRVEEPAGAPRASAQRSSGRPEAGEPARPRTNKARDRTAKGARGASRARRPRPRKRRPGP
jgi:hypothetical protein